MSLAHQTYEKLPPNCLFQSSPIPTLLVQTFATLILRVQCHSVLNGKLSTEKDIFVARDCSTFTLYKSDLVSHVLNKSALVSLLCDVVWACSIIAGRSKLLFGEQKTKTQMLANQTKRRNFLSLFSKPADAYCGNECLFNM